ncbi:sensor histidine kinase [Paenibacillus sp. LHD-117]|uniref:cache domain-containing sensor histidine kinase n=1 Tax=Paenibacillus sp. LHD-117 TaxID=3071412 RepID=UPI0027E128EB|nr:sensor histidine kinase [Paenibacillus sp. LHD-117]MDQ6419780.1 sensor histidine kinase [Paenibacillus sp. LHD-117]
MSDKLRMRFRMSFTTKMIVAFVLVILIPTLFTSFSFYVVSNSTVKQNVREASIQIAKQGADSLSFIFNAGSDVSDMIYIDPRVQHVIANQPASGADLLLWRENEEYMKSFLNNIVYSSSFVNIVYVLKDHETGWGSGTFSRIKLARYFVEEKPWAQEAEKLEGGLVWNEIRADQLSSGGDTTELVLPIGRAIKDYDSGETVGYILVNLNGRKVIDKIDEMKLGKTGSFMVVNGEGRIMVASDTESIGQIVRNEELLAHVTGNPYIEFEFKRDEVPYYGVKQTLSNGWLLVGTVPVHEITDRLSALHRNILFSFGIFTLLGIGMGLIIASRVTQPVKQLTRGMKQVQKGDLTVRTDVNTNDEFGLMSHQFNKMIGDINLLMEQVTEEQRLKQEAELRAAVHRINPHFLFNTLGTIRWLIKYGQSERAYEGISALTRLLEANMGRKGNFITIAEELDIIEKYLVILEMRYSRRFTLHVRKDEEAAKLLVPRMLIQPLVENAIFHGIVPKGSDGEIVIEVAREGEATIITVFDDGIGLLPGKEKVLESVERAVKDGEAGIGLQHVYECTRLYFDRESGVSIHSREEGGTLARILLIPKEDAYVAGNHRGR